MIKSPRSTSRAALLIRSILISMVGLAVLGASARAQEVEAAAPAARPTPTFSRLAVSKGVLNFHRLIFPAGPRSEELPLVVENTGNVTLSSVVVGPISGKDPGAFNLGANGS